MKSVVLTAVITAVIVSGAWIAALFKDVDTVTLDGLDIFFVIATFASLIFNVVQWQQGREKNTPVRNALIAMFNELKNRQQRCFGKRQRVTTPNVVVNLGEFVDFVEEMLQGYEQLREHVIGLIETVAPSTPDDAFFRAAERGLTPEEREMRKQSARSYLERMVERDRRLAAGGPNVDPPPNIEPPRRP